MPEATLVAPVKELTYIQAVNEALRWALAEYPEAIVFGEDVGLPGGPYGASRGLRKEFGARVFDTPISESAIIGAAVGAAMRGLRPIVEIMFADFFLVALEVIDLRWLSPLDFEAVAASVGCTSRLVVAHEANLTGGFGAEIAARAAKECFWALDAPIERVALPDTRIPAAPVLQQALVPGADSIVTALRRVAWA